MALHAVSVDDLESAWTELHEANKTLGWFIGPTTFEPRFEKPWSMWAADMTEKSKLGRRTREWTSIGPTEAACVRNMARALSEISEGRVPR